MLAADLAQLDVPFDTGRLFGAADEDYTTALAVVRDVVSERNRAQAEAERARHG